MCTYCNAYPGRKPETDKAAAALYSKWLEALPVTHRKLVGTDVVVSLDASNAVLTQEELAQGAQPVDFRHGVVRNLVLLQNLKSCDENIETNYNQNKKHEYRSAG